MIDLSLAIEKLKANIKPIKEIEEVSLLDAYGKILNEDIYADISVPPFPKSAMDGYAVRSIDLKEANIKNGVELKVIGEVFAGDDKSISLKPFEAIRIMTGGKIPKNSDAVVKQEDTDYGMDIVKVYTNIKPFDNYCRVGEDILKGSLVVKKSTVLNSVHIGLLASMGITSIKVLRKLRVGIITTGSEVVMPGEILKAGKIFNSSGFIFASKIKSQGLKVEFMINCEDSIDSLKKAINENIDKVDLILTSGGVSVGKKDLMPYIVEEIGAKKIFHKIKIKPGTHALASFYKNKIILSLSGNPFAALTTFELLFWPIIECYTNNRHYKLNSKSCVYKGEKLKKNELTRYVRAYAENGRVELLSNIHSSSVISNMSRCNCFIKQPPEKEIFDDDMVDIIYIKSI